MERYDAYILFAAVAVLLGAAAARDKLPSASTVHDMVSLLDTKGGNIAVLLFMTLYFFHRTEVMYYHVVELIRAHTLEADNGIALNALLFATTAFGGASGALLKVMSGVEPTFKNGIGKAPAIVPPPDIPPTSAVVEPAVIAPAP